VAAEANTSRQVYQVTPGQLEAWRESAAIQAFLRSEELTTLNLDYSTLSLGQECHGGQSVQEWHNYDLAALLYSMPQITSLNPSSAVVKSRGENPYAWLSSSTTRSPVPITLLCQGICSLTRLRTLCVPGFFRDARERPMNEHTMLALAEALHRLPQLEALDFRDNILSRKHAPVLAVALQGLSGLTELKLFGSGSIHAEQVRQDALAEGQVLFGAIGSLSSLRTLYIMGHGDMPKHAPAVATALSDALLELTQLEFLI